MKVLIRNEIVEMPVTSVVLDSNPLDKQGLEMVMFFCNKCQNPIFQHNSTVVKIFPGLIPHKPPVVIQCPKCKSKYAIQSIV